MAHEALCPYKQAGLIGQETLLGDPQADRAEGAQVVSLTLKGSHSHDELRLLPLLGHLWEGFQKKHTDSSVKQWLVGQRMIKE